MNQVRLSRILNLASSWLLLAGTSVILILVNSSFSWISAIVLITAVIVTAIDPIAYYFWPAPSFQKEAEYYRPRLLWVWIVFATVIILSVVRSFISLPIDKVGAIEDSLIGKVRSVLFVLIVALLLGGFLYRLILSLEASSEDTIRDQSVRGRFGSMFALHLIAVLIALTSANVAAAWFNASYDLSPGFYSYSDAAKSVIQSIKRPVKVIAFLPVQQVISDTGRRTTANELFKISEDLRLMLEQLEIINSNIKVEILNADLIEPTNQEFRSITNGTILIRSYATEATATTPYAERRVYVYGEKELAEFEKNFIEGLVHVSLPASAIYFTRENGELRSSNRNQSGNGVDEWLNSLRYFNFTISQIDKAIDIEIPADAKAVVMMGPTTPYSKNSRQAVINYLHSGGSVYGFATDQEDFSWLLEEVGSQYRRQPGYLSMFARNPGLLITNGFSDHKVVSNLKNVIHGSLVVVGNGFFEKKQSSPPGMIAYKENLLVHSDVSAFHDRNRNGRREPGEDAGRFVLALLYEARNDNPPNANETTKQGGKLVLFADPGIFTNSVLSFPVDKDNQRFSVDSMLWLVGGDDIAGVVVKPRLDRAIQVNDDLKMRNIVLGVFGFPLVTALMIGISLYLYRRRRRFQEDGSL